MGRGTERPHNIQKLLTNKFLLLPWGRFFVHIAFSLALIAPGLGLVIRHFDKKAGLAEIASPAFLYCFSFQLGNPLVVVL